LVDATHSESSTTTAPPAAAVLRHPTRAYCSPPPQGCVQLEKGVAKPHAYTGHASVLHAWLSGAWPSGLTAAAAHLLASVARPVLESMHVSVRLCTPPPQLAEHELQALY